MSDEQPSIEGKPPINGKLRAIKDLDALITFAVENREALDELLNDLSRFTRSLIIMQMFALLKHLTGNLAAGSIGWAAMFNEMIREAQEASAASQNDEAEK